jgi:predicted ferric reductase
MKTVVRGSIWFGLYLFLIVLPLIVGAATFVEVPDRSFSLNFSAAIAYIGFAIMAFEFALISRLGAASGAFGNDAMLQFHRMMGIVGVMLVLVHPILLLFNRYGLAMFNPFDGSVLPLIRAGAVSFYAALLLIALSLWRKQLRLSYEFWQLSHTFLTFFVLITAAAHIVVISNAIGTFERSGPMRLLWVVYFIILLSLFFRYRLIKPLQLRKKPWEIISNVAQPGNQRTLTLKPVGHPGFTFEPGQFSWLITGKSPFSFMQHPISMSSNADAPDGTIAFTIKALGDWSTKVVPNLKPGRLMWVDGPYGVFSADREQGMGYALFGGGVGITPMFSIIQTLCERGDARPVVLFYSAAAVEDLTFKDELDQLSQKMNLKLVYVIEKPPADWEGESGFVTAEIIRRHLPAQFRRFQFLCCGPGKYMDAVEDAVASLGVPVERIHTERFDMV